MEHQKRVSVNYSPRNLARRESNAAERKINGIALPRHAHCTPDDPPSRRAFEGVCRFEVVVPGGTNVSYCDFVTAKRALDASFKATMVRCMECGASLAEHKADRDHGEFA